MLRNSTIVPPHMLILHTLIAFVAAGLFVYLLVALLKPELFP